MHASQGAGRLLAGRYRLQDPIGRGSMGIVWRGRDELLHRDVAVKEVHLTAFALEAGTPTSADVAYQRALREARTAARLTHPSAVTVFDVVEEDGSPWIIMELVRARPLDRVIIEDGPLPPLEAAELGSSLIGALAAAHEAGVLHRDVKPSNVLVTSDGHAVLTDFGIATFAEDPTVTQAGIVVGTPGFTAPERVRGDIATPASDLWSLGATLFAAVEGRGPFDRVGGSTAISAGVAVEDAPRAPSAGPLGPVIDALLRRDPATRPTAAAAAKLLSEAATAARTGARPLGDGWLAAEADTASGAPAKIDVAPPADSRTYIGAAARGLAAAAAAADGSADEGRGEDAVDAAALDRPVLAGAAGLAASAAFSDGAELNDGAAFNESAASAQGATSAGAAAPIDKTATRDRLAGSAAAAGAGLGISAGSGIGADSSTSPAAALGAGPGISAGSGIGADSGSSPAAALGTGPGISAGSSTGPAAALGAGPGTSAGSSTGPGAALGAGPDTGPAVADAAGIGASSAQRRAAFAAAAGHDAALSAGSGPVPVPAPRDGAAGISSDPSFERGAAARNPGAGADSVGRAAFLDPPVYADLSMPAQTGPASFLPEELRAPEMPAGPFADVVASAADPMPRGAINQAAASGAGGAVTGGSGATGSGGAGGNSGTGGGGRRALHRGGQPRPSSGRWRVMVACAGIAAIAVAAVIGWDVYSHTQAPLALQGPATTGGGGTGGSGSSSPANGSHSGSAAAGKSGSSGSAGNGRTGTPGTSHGQSPGTSKPSGKPSGKPSSRPSPSLGASSSIPTTTSPSSSPSPSPSPTSTQPVLPASWVWHSFTAAQMTSNAGFEIGMPAPWTQNVIGQVAHLNQTVRDFHLAVSLATWTYAKPLNQARYLDSIDSTTYNKFKTLLLRSIGFAAAGGYEPGTAAELKFTWTKPEVGKFTELIILVTLNTSSGAQPYEFALWAPSATFDAASAIFHTALHSFRPLPVT